MDEALFSVGDIVRVKDYETLVSEFGVGVDIPSGFNGEMRRYCGKEFEIEEVFRRTDRKFAYYLSNHRRFIWDECVLVRTDPHQRVDTDSFEISFDSVLNGVGGVSYV